MAKRLSGLGRGIDNIFFDNSIERENPITSMRIAQIEPKSDQPRKNFDTESLAGLADSIAAHGVLQPILVRESEAGFYQIIAGERRWRASKMAGLTEIPVIVTKQDDKNAAQCAIIENVQRENLNPVEEAFGYKTLADDYNMTQEEISSVIGKSRSSIANSLRLLDLPEAALSMLSAGKFTAGHARALLSLKNKENILPLAEKIYSKQMSVREAENMAAALNKPPKLTPETEEGGRIRIDYFSAVENKLMGILGRRVKIHGSGRKKRIEISYEDNEDLEILLAKITGKSDIEY